MEIKAFAPGDKVKIQTKNRTWEGYILESHDPEIILLKLPSGYNIGIREGEILDATILEKASYQRSVLPAKRPTSEASYKNYPT